MNDLDKMMKKLKDKPTEETEKKEVKTPAPKPIVEETKDPDAEFDEDNETSEVEEKVEEDKPQEEKEHPDQAIDHEVAVLQNNGVFRRELILTLKELVDVMKVQTQTFLDIKKKLVGEKDGQE